MSVLKATKKNLPRSEPSHSGDFFRKNARNNQILIHHQLLPRIIHQRKLFVETSSGLYPRRWNTGVCSITKSSVPKGDFLQSKPQEMHTKFTVINISHHIHYYGYQFFLTYAATLTRSQATLTPESCSVFIFYLNAMK